MVKAKKCNVVDLDLDGPDINGSGRTQVEAILQEGMD